VLSAGSRCRDLTLFEGRPPRGSQRSSVGRFTLASLTRPAESHQFCRGPEQPVSRRALTPDNWHATSLPTIPNYLTSGP
jgi:hypothetical protein